MPDQSDVEAALAAAAADALYPDGVTRESALGVLCRVFRGFPTAAALDADLAAGRVNVSVVPVDGSYRNTTRFMSGLADSPALPTLLISFAGDTVTLAGTAEAGQLAGVLVDGGSFVHRTGPGETPALVAAALAALVRAERPAVLSGTSVSFPGAGRVVGRTVADTPDTVELRRQVQEFRMTVWAPSAAMRDAAGAALDGRLACVTFLPVEGVPCFLRCSGSATSDRFEAAALFRRDLLFSVEYPTTATVTRPAMLFGRLTDNSIPNLV